MLKKTITFFCLLFSFSAVHAVDNLTDADRKIFIERDKARTQKLLTKFTRTSKKVCDKKIATSIDFSSLGNAYSDSSMAIFESMNKNSKRFISTFTDICNGNKDFKSDLIKVKKINITVLNEGRIWKFKRRGSTLNVDLPNIRGKQEFEKKLIRSIR